MRGHATVNGSSEMAFLRDVLPYGGGTVTDGMRAYTSSFSN